MTKVTQIDKGGRKIGGPALVPVVGPLLRKYRELLGMTQQEAGRLLGYSYGNFIGMIETGSARFPTERWEEYAEAFEIPKIKLLQAVIKEQFPNMLPFLEFLTPKEKTVKQLEKSVDEDKEDHYASS